MQTSNPMPNPVGLTAWAYLPNAAHIDKLLRLAKTRPDEWAVAWSAAKNAASDAVAQSATRSAAWDATRSAAWNAAMDAAWDAAWDATRNAAWNAARDAAKDAAWNAARNVARNVARDAAWSAAWDATQSAAWAAAMSLIAHDDCAALLLPTTPVAVLEARIELDADPASTLLLPYKLFLEVIRYADN